jgi:hypothetical protein
MLRTPCTVLRERKVFPGGLPPPTSHAETNQWVGAATVAAAERRGEIEGRDDHAAQARYRGPEEGRAQGARPCGGVEEVSCDAKDRTIADLRGPTLDGCKTAIPKLKEGTQNFYDHVDFGYKWLRRFDSADVPLLTGAVLRKLARERQEEEGADFCYHTMMTNAFKSARDELLNASAFAVGKYLHSTHTHTMHHQTGRHLYMWPVEYGPSFRDIHTHPQNRVSGTSVTQVEFPGHTHPPHRPTRRPRRLHKLSFRDTRTPHRLTRCPRRLHKLSTGTD